MIKPYLKAGILIVIITLLYSCADKELPLAQLTTSEVTNISATTATTGGVIISDAGSTVTSRGVCWNTTPSPTV